MSYTETPVPTDIERLFEAQEQLNQRIDKLVDAVNGLGANQQWLIDQAKGIFQMFSSPQFMSSVLSGGVLNGGNNGPGPAGRPSEG